MANLPIQAAGTIVKVDGVVLAKVRTLRITDNLDEEDVTGTEDFVGNLVTRKFIPVARGTQMAIEGVAISGTDESAEYEPGQQDALDAMRAGVEIDIEQENKFGYGGTYTGYLTQYERGFDSVDGVYTYSGTLRVNEYAAVTP